MRQIKAKINGKTYNLYYAQSSKSGVVGDLETTLLQMRGLLGRNLKDNEGMIFPHEKMLYPIHTWFMKYPLTLLYLDENLEIIEIKDCIHPFNKYHPKKKSNYLIELRYNPEEKYKEGDVITLQPPEHS